MLDSAGGGSEKQVGQETVPVGTHRDQITTFIFNPVDDLLGRVAVGQFGISRDSLQLKLALNAMKISRIFGDFATDSIGAIGSGSPAIRHVQKHQPAMSELGELLHMLNNGAIRWSAIQRQQD